MHLVDSNIVIYSYFEKYEYLKKILYNDLVYVSEISRIEVLGYHKLTLDEETYYKDFFKFMPVIYPTQDIVDKTIEIRKQYNLKLGDGLIAATALINDLTIYTRNIADFKRIDNLKFIDPIK
jgi:predicted nucleic acid-binding protein